MDDDRFVPEPITLPYTVILQESDPNAIKLPYAYTTTDIIDFYGELII